MAEETTSPPLMGSDENKTRKQMGGDKGTKDGDKDRKSEDNGEVEGSTSSIKSITGSTEEELLAKLEAQNREYSHLVLTLQNYCRMVHFHVKSDSDQLTFLRPLQYMKPMTLFDSFSHLVYVVASGGFLTSS